MFLPSFLLNIDIDFLGEVLFGASLFSVQALKKQEEHDILSCVITIFHHA
jgi:hypothetical protein